MKYLSSEMCYENRRNNIVFPLYSQVADGEKMGIVLDFDVIENMTEAARFVKPVEPREGSVDSQPILPRADFKKCQCNCSSFPDIKGIFVNDERPRCFLVFGFPHVSKTNA